ncbi:MAG TPA: branched-chain amino acid aminotransferase [Steroidobacteraceae bacterium]|jgi:branched-chain amino acid aminotransferase|nr:branched-chain amino acid aminotransferase [Steroidobacteraceae bacterium]
MTSQPQRPAFGTLLASHMAVTHYRDGSWSPSEVKPVGAIEISPAAHMLHYASTCFEGFKAFRRADGSVHIFRMDRHMQRLLQSARQLVLPPPDIAQVADMVRAVIKRCRDAVPEAPGALYLRPIIFGTTANIGAATTPTTEAMLVVLASPVWDYFTGGAKPLRILVDDQNTRSAQHMGMVKTGGNYAAALIPIMDARVKHQADQVLFCPGGQVQETGAANFMLIREGELLTRSLDSTFLHGVTRDSLLTLGRDMGYTVTEKKFDVLEMLDWVRTGEAALSGTAAVLAGVGTLIYADTEHRVGTGQVGEVTKALRAKLIAVQRGEEPDRHGWLERV